MPRGDALRRVPPSFFQKIKSQLYLSILCRFAEEQAVGLLDAGRVVFPSGRCQAPGKKFRLTHDQIAVQEEQSLQRHVRVAPLIAADVGIRKVKQLQCRVQPSRARATNVRRAPDSRVNGAFLVLRAHELLWRPSKRFIERSGNEQERVPES